MRSIMDPRAPRWLAAGLVVAGSWVLVGCSEEAPSAAPPAASSSSPAPADGASDKAATTKAAGGSEKKDVMPEIPKKARN